jgi:GntR family transcriptional repressor for pyruvate dehydrogenase complex
MVDQSIGLIRPVAIRSASDTVFDRLQALILDGSLKPGDRLPAEPELAAALGVGRSTVREAKKTLLAHGLLESRGKLGTVVVTPPTDPSNLPALRQLLDDPTLADLHETRQIVEVASIRLAARRATPADVADLHATLDRIEEDIGRTDGDAWIRLVSFHRNLVRASGNKVLLNLFDLLAHLLRRHQVPFYGSVAELQSELRAHRELVEIVERHDPEGAAAEMRHHLEDSEQLRQNALDEVKPDDEPS